MQERLSVCVINFQLPCHIGKQTIRLIDGMAGQTCSFGTRICFRSEQMVRISTTQLHACICFIRTASCVPLSIRLWFTPSGKTSSLFLSLLSLSLCLFFSPIPFTRTTMEFDSPDFNRDVNRSCPRVVWVIWNFPIPEVVKYRDRFLLEKIDRRTADIDRICSRAVGRNLRDSSRAQIQFPDCSLFEEKLHRKENTPYYFSS